MSELYRIKIYLFGEPIVEWDGHPLSIPRRQARALLYRLAAHIEPVHREQLCFLFWPDTSESSARRNLTRLLTHLRRSLPSTDFLNSGKDIVGLESTRVWSDSAAFQQLITESNPQEAVHLYRGPFLNRISLSACPEFEMWVTQERHTYERLYLESLAALIEVKTAQSQYEDAITYALRYLETDAVAEEVHRRLIELYALTGHRTAALRQFEYCVAIMERELGVSPLPQTMASYQTILEGRSPLDIPAVPAQAEVYIPSMQIPLVGRDDLLHQLEQIYRLTHSGQGRVVFLSGEPGIGKSRLMDVFAARCQTQTLVLQGAADPSTQSLPYHPVIQALRTALQIKWQTLTTEPTWLSEAARLFPELRAMYPDLPPPMPSGAEETHTRLFEALCQLLFGLATASPSLLLCLDDLHWADNTTLEWLAYLAKRVRHRPVLVLGTYLGEDEFAISELRRSLSRQGVLHEFKLDGLKIDNVRHIVRHASLPDEKGFTRRLWEITGGNPFFLVETIQSFLESGQSLADLVSSEDAHLPDTILRAVETRLSRLSPVTRQVLEAFAVNGPSCDLNLARLTAGRSEMETIDGLDELLARQLLIDDNGEFRFRHHIIQTAVYRGLSPWRRRLLHQRAGEALERQGSDNWATLVWHFEQAKSPRKAARFALQAGSSIKSIFAYVEAGNYFNRALSLLEAEAAELNEPDQVAANWRLRIQALAERGWVFRLLGDMHAYEQDLQREANLVVLLGDQSTLAHLRWREAVAHRWFCRYAQALQSAQEGLWLSQEIGDSLLEALCLREAGMINRALGDFQQALVSLERALRLFEILGESIYQIHTLGNLSTLYVYTGDYAQAMGLGKQALSLCNQSDLIYERRLPLGDMGAAAAALGKMELALKYLQESLEIARQITDRTQEIICLGHLGWVYIKLNQPTQAHDHLQAALTLAEIVNSYTEQSWLHAGLSEAHRLEGDFIKAKEHAHRALEFAERFGHTRDLQTAHQIITNIGEISG